MDKSSIKNFIIILLALVNVFLLFIVISSAIEGRKVANYRMEALENVLSENGITLNPDIKLPNIIPPQLSLKRDLGTEARHLSGLIGKCTPVGQGGNIFFYEGADGQATFHGTGDFEISLNSGVISKGKNPVGAAKVALKKMDLECSYIEPIITTDGDYTTVTIYCSWGGITIYNIKISFVFNSDYLWLISGTRPMDTRYSAQSTENYPDSVTVLMNYLKSINDTGDVCSEINDLKIGYCMNSAVSENCTLRPVWCIETNSGSHYIDAETGKAENIKSSS